MSGSRNLALAAGFLLSAGLAGAAEGPILRSLRGAAVAPMGATLEMQSSNVGASFVGHQQTGAVPGHAAGRRAGAPRLSGPASLSKPSKDVPSPIPEKEQGTLKLVRGAGLGAAAAGVGLFAFALATAATGPIGWAAALVFFGGMAAYLAHRRLSGKNDFK